MRRRDWLRLTLGGATLAAWETDRAPPPVRAQPPLPAVPDAVWRRFASTLSGRLVRPDARDYARARRLYDPSYDDVRPAAIVFCASQDDVRRTIELARAHGLPFTARCGGHSYGGYSTCEGIVCDVGGLSAVTVDRAARTATIGAGARLIDVYAGTAPHSLAVPGGTCASVGISGLTLGGGQGVLGRKHGLTCDSLRALTLITAAGDVVTCDASDNEDLYWASRGAGGGNFGVATSFTFDAYPVDTLTRFSARFTWAAARDVVAGWQEWMQGAPPELWSALHLNTSGTARGASLAGCYAGPERALAPHLAALRRRMGRALRRAPSTITAGYLDTMRAEAGCSERTIDECHLPTAREGGQLGRRSHEGFSNIYRAPLTTRGIAALVELIEARGPDAAGAGGVAIDALGGAIDRLAPDATAFVHRGAFAIAQCSTHWPARVTEAQIRANRAWHRQLRRTMARHVGGGAYVNYIDPALRDHETVYYGDNLARLRQIKARRDPDGFFRFAQGIRASG